MFENANCRNTSTTWKVVLVCLAIAGALALCVFAFAATQSNGALSLEQQIESSQSDINVQEKRRADLIPNLVECVKGYSEHEYSTLKDVIAERGSENPEAASMINMVAEQYPALKADETYKSLMNELSTTENLIAQYRSTYNNHVRDYTYYVNAFPHNIALALSGYPVKEYDYLAYEDAGTDAPTVSFE